MNPITSFLSLKELPLCNYLQNNSVKVKHIYVFMAI